MFRNEDAEWEQFRDLTEIMENAGQKKPSENFTSAVMARLSEGKETIKTFSLGRLFSNNLNFSFQNSVTKTECAFCFFLTGFFYLIIGSILMVGIQGIGSSMAAMEWIKLQPHLTIGEAIWLLVLGVILMIAGSAGMKIAKYGTLLYIFFAVVNSMLLRPYLRFPYADIFIIGLAATGALMGIMLVQVVQKMELRPV